jgi:membrane protease YdiL (CAAX protease family)
LRRIASPIHTIVLLWAVATIVARGLMHGNELRSASRVHIYERTMLMERREFAFVLLGVWWAGSPLSVVLGQRWRSIWDFVRVLGIGIGYSIVSTMVLSVLLPHGGDSSHSVQFLMPQGRTEMMLWLALSVSAGICEETLDRGYLQTQFAALTNSLIAGIAMSGMAFGLAHAYQGPRQAVVIAIDGMMLGGLVHWRTSVRPGMIAPFKDCVAPFVIAATRH